MRWPPTSRLGSSVVAAAGVGYLPIKDDYLLITDQGSVISPAIDTALGGTATTVLP